MSIFKITYFSIQSNSIQFLFGDLQFKFYFACVVFKNLVCLNSSFIICFCSPVFTVLLFNMIEVYLSHLKNSNNNTTLDKNKSVVIIIQQTQCKCLVAFWDSRCKFLHRTTYSGLVQVNTKCWSNLMLNDSMEVKQSDQQKHYGEMNPRLDGTEFTMN